MVWTPFEFPWMGPLMDSYGLDCYGPQPLGFSFAIRIVGVLTLSAVHGALCLRPCVGNLERMAHAQQRPIEDAQNSIRIFQFCAQVPHAAVFSRWSSQPWYPLEATRFVIGSHVVVPYTIIVLHTS